MSDQPDPRNVAALEELAGQIGLTVPPMLAELFTHAGAELRQNYSSRFELMIVEYLPLAEGRASALQIHRNYQSRAGLPRELFPVAIDEGGRAVFVDCTKEELAVWVHDAYSAGEPPLQSLGVGLREFMSSFDDRIEDLGLGPPDAN